MFKNFLTFFAALFLCISVLAAPPTNTPPNPTVISVMVYTNGALAGSSTNLFNVNSNLFSKTGLSVGFVLQSTLTALSNSFNSSITGLSTNLNADNLASGTIPAARYGFVPATNGAPISILQLPNTVVTNDIIQDSYGNSFIRISSKGTLGVALQNGGLYQGTNGIVYISSGNSYQPIGAIKNGLIVLNDGLNGITMLDQALQNVFNVSPAGGLFATSLSDPHGQLPYSDAIVTNNLTFPLLSSSPTLGTPATNELISRSYVDSALTRNLIYYNSKELDGTNPYGVPVFLYAASIPNGFSITNISPTNGQYLMGTVVTNILAYSAPFFNTEIIRGITSGGNAECLMHYENYWSTNDGASWFGDYVSPSFNLILDGNPHSYSEYVQVPGTIAPGANMKVYTLVKIESINHVSSLIFFGGTNNYGIAGVSFNIGAGTLTGIYQPRNPNLDVLSTNNGNNLKFSEIPQDIQNYVTEQMSNATPHLNWFSGQPLFNTLSNIAYYANGGIWIDETGAVYYPTTTPGSEIILLASDGSSLNYPSGVSLANVNGDIFYPTGVGLVVSGGTQLQFPNGHGLADSSGNIYFSSGWTLADPNAIYWSGTNQKFADEFGNIWSKNGVQIADENGLISGGGGSSLLLDQTTPQTVSNGVPIFANGLQAGSTLTASTSALRVYGASGNTFHFEDAAGRVLSDGDGAGVLTWTAVSHFGTGSFYNIGDTEYQGFEPSRYGFYARCAPSSYTGIMRLDDEYGNSVFTIDPSGNTTIIGGSASMGTKFLDAHASQGTDYGQAVLGAALMGTFFDGTQVDYAVFGNRAVLNADPGGGYSLLADSSGNTYFNASSQLYFRINNVDVMNVSSMGTKFLDAHASQGTDYGQAVLGAALIGTFYDGTQNTFAVFGNRSVLDSNPAGGYAILAENTGNTYFNASSQLYFRINNVDVMNVSNNSLNAPSITTPASTFAEDSDSGGVSYATWNLATGNIQTLDLTGLGINSVNITITGEASGQNCTLRIKNDTHPFTVTTTGTTSTIRWASGTGSADSCTTDTALIAIQLYSTTEAIAAFKEIP